MASIRAAASSILLLITVTLAAQNLTTYMPECVQPCLERSINSTGSCTGPEDSQCLCSNEARIGYSAWMCAQEAGSCSNSTDQLRGAMMSAYQQYCTDVGVTGSWNSRGSFPGFTASQTGAVTSTAMSSSTTPPPTSTPTATNDEPTSSGSGGSSSGLSTGAIAGIAVGGGVAVISITGGLLLLAFRLGKGYSNRKKGEDAAGSGEQGGGEGGSGNGGPDTDETALKNEAQLDGKPVSELQTEFTLSGFNPIKELQTQERPAELPADPLPRYVEDHSPVLPESPWRIRDHNT
ncbi:hypothetical protein K449DRAFT_465339 [Hypoxylon sp. EC38]|nr:hypothetical protein K449DRAFT_465339 [Hypoxylon sp. EC38]